MKIEDLNFVVIGSSDDEYIKFIDQLSCNKIFLKSRFICTNNDIIFNLDNYDGYDYIIVLNNITYDKLQQISNIADGRNKTVLFLNKSIHPLCSITIGDTVLYIKEPKNGLINDSIFRVNEISYELEQNIHMIRTASAPNIPNINGIIYTKDSIMGIGGLGSNYFKELLKTNKLNVEYGSSKDKLQSIIRFSTIDPEYIIGSIKAIGDRFLFIKSNKKFIEVFNNMTDNELIGFMRYTGHLYNKDSEIKPITVEIENIITWDIWYANELSLQYLETLR